VRANPRISSSLQQLTEHPYDINAGDFVRFRVEANDDIVGGLVRSVASESDADREHFRRGLSDDASTMRLFAMRRTLLARRQSSMSLVYEALDGFALLGFDDVPWDSWLKASLFVARLVGGDPELIRRRFADVAHEDAAARFDVALEAMNRVNDLSQCSLVEVKTTYGVGFVETFIFRDRPTFALRGAPSQSDNRVDYHPETNLAQLAVIVADELDASATFVAGPITQDQLAATSFSRTSSGSYLPATGCLSFVAAGKQSSTSFTVFVAELPADTDVEALATAAINTADQAAVVDANRLIVLSPQPNFGDDVDVLIDFHDVEAFARSALEDPSTK
jgi:hypothetical protein